VSVVKSTAPPRTAWCTFRTFGKRALFFYSLHFVACHSSAVVCFSPLCYSSMCTLPLLAYKERQDLCYAYCFNGSHRPLRESQR